MDTFVMRRVGWSIVLMLLIAACGNEAEPEPFTLRSMAAENSFTVSVDGDVIPWVEFFLDDESEPRLRDEEAPFSYTQHFDELSVGEHTITAIVAIDLLGTVSTVTREASFEVASSEPAPSEPVEPGSEPLARPVSAYYYMGYIGKIDSWQRNGTDEYHVGAASNGWDWWDLPDGGSPTVYERDDWAHFRLAREATVGVVWLDDRGPDAWLGDWTSAGAVTVKGETGELYTKVLPAGWHSLPSFNHRPAGRIYELLFAEATGNPTPYPTAPDGLEQPVPGEYCPAWVHDRHVTDYGHATWHPQVDPAYWCYFGHEHGTEPASLGVDFEPTFDHYGHLVGKGEAHEGFKLMGYYGDDDTKWIIVIHWTSGLEMRKCVRHHAYEFHAWDASNTKIVEILGKGDTGGLSNSSIGKRVNPDDCPTVNENSAHPFGMKNIPEYPDTGYESWQIHPGAALPFVGRVFHATTAPALVCGDIDCDTMVPRDPQGRHGTQRWSNTYSAFGNHFGFDGGASGFSACTDYTGNTLLPCDDAHAISHYVAPGLHTVSKQGDRFYALDPWTGILVGPDLDPDSTDDHLTAPMNIGDRVKLMN